MASRTTKGSDRTLVDSAVRTLREEILSGKLRPGERLMLMPLAEQLDMSVIPLREALKRLEHEGLVDAQAHRGTWVREMSLADLLDLYRIRIQLERYAVAEAAKRITPETEAPLREILSQYRLAYEQDRPLDGHDLHSRFHLGLYRLAGSDWLMRAIQPLWDASARYQRYSAQLRGDMEQRFRGHTILLDRCAAGDPVVAGDTLEQHLQHSLDLIRATFVEAE